MASRRTRGISEDFHKRAPIKNVAPQVREMAVAMVDHSAMASGEDTLKWLVTPRAAAPTMMISSITRKATMPAPSHQPKRLERAAKE